MVTVIGLKLIRRHTIDEFRVLQMIQVKEMYMFCEVSVVKLRVRTGYMQRRRDGLSGVL